MSNTEIPDDFFDELIAEMGAKGEHMPYPLSDSRGAFHDAGGSTTFSQSFSDPNSAIDLLRRLSPSQESITHERQAQLAVEDAIFNRIMSDSILSHQISNWDNLPQTDRQAIATEIARVHSETLGYGMPEVSGTLTGFANSDKENGQYRSNGGLVPGRIEVDMQRAFPNVLETIIHENTHNHQDQLRMRPTVGMDDAQRSLQEVMQVTWDRVGNPQAYYDLPREVHARDWQQVGERIAIRAGMITVDREHFPDRNRPYATQYETQPVGLGEDQAIRYYTTETLVNTMREAAGAAEVETKVAAVDAPETFTPKVDSKASSIAGNSVGTSGVGLGVYGLVSRSDQTMRDIETSTVAGVSSIVGTTADASNVLLDAANMKFTSMPSVLQRSALPLAIVSTAGEMSAGIATGDEVRTTKAVVGFGGALLGAKMGGASGAVLGPWGAAAGGVIGAVVGGLLGEEAVEALMSGDDRDLTAVQARAEAVQLLRQIPMHPDALSFVTDRELRELSGYVHNVVELEAQMIAQAAEQAQGNEALLERLQTPGEGVGAAMEVLSQDPEFARMAHSYNTAQAAMLRGLEAYVQEHPPEETNQLLTVANQRWKNSEEYQWMLADMAEAAGVSASGIVVSSQDDIEPRGAAELTANMLHTNTSMQL